MASEASAWSVVAAKSFCLDAPALGGGGRTQGLGHQKFATALLRQLPHVAALDAQPVEQRVHGELRVAGGRRAVVRPVVGVAGNQRPTGVVEMHVEAGQHQRAVRQVGDGREQPGGRRHRAGRAGGDHRRVAGRKPLGLGLDQSVAPLGRIDGVPLGEEFAPARVDEFEEVERLLPVFVEVLRHQLVEIVPGHLARGHVVHQPRQRVGERQHGLRRIRDQRRALPGRDGGGPRRNEFGQRQPPLQPAESRRQCERGFREVARGGFGKGDFVFVEIAERDDARQNGGVGFQFVEEDLARQAAGAPGRQIERGLAEFERVVGGRKAGHQFAGAQRADQHAQKRRRGGDIEDVWLCGRHS